MLDAFFQRLWYERAARWLSILLLPLSWVFGAVVALRRWAYRSGLLTSHRAGRPVVVVGNISVGGAGKTPLTIWLASQLAARGVRVGIILRGYGGRADQWPREVTSATPVIDVGDEAVLLARRTSAIVIAGPDRVADAQRAIARGAQIVLSDDGLQHYRLTRDCEIAVVDAQRGLGNGRLLPAGPLREPRSRLESVDLVALTSRTASGTGMTFGGRGQNRIFVAARLGDAISLASGEARPLAAFKGARAHAIAAVGNPGSFFAALAAAGLSIDAHALPDHAQITPEDVRFDDDAPVLMTEKDAVKCGAFADERLWAVRMDLEMSVEDLALVNGIIDRLLATPRPPH